jgi:hypothetical protein
MNLVIAWLMRFPDAERKAFLLSASQKSLPTAAVVIEAIDNPALNAGLMTIPCMVFYIMQLFIDSFISAGWAGKYERADALREKYAEALEKIYAMDNPEYASRLHAAGSMSLASQPGGGGPTARKSPGVSPGSAGAVTAAGAAAPAALRVEPAAVPTESDRLLGGHARS